MNGTQATLVTTMHNMESVVEVYLDVENRSVTEVKHLNYNRVKAYSYPVDEYLGIVKHLKSVTRKISELI